MTEPNRAEVRAAALAFRELHPEYIVCPENAKILETELVRIVEEEECRPDSVLTYLKAFSRVEDQLKLNRPETKRPEDMTPQELLQLSEREKDQLPTHLLKRLAEFEFKQRRSQPEESEEEKLIQSIFADEGYACTDSNRNIVGNWLIERGLAILPTNIREGIEETHDFLSLSKEVIDGLSSDQYRKQVVELEFKKATTENPPRERNWPAGIRYTSWLHNK